MSSQQHPSARDEAADPCWLLGTSNQCPLYPRKQTSVECCGMSAMCQKRKSLIPGEAPARFDLGLDLDQFRESCSHLPFIFHRFGRCHRDPLTGLMGSE